MRLDTLGEQMQMVRHDAVGMDGEAVRRGCLMEYSEEPFALLWVVEDSMTSEATDGYEIGGLA